MRFTIDDEKVTAVLAELSFRLGVDKETIVKVALRELANQYIKKPTLAMQFVKMHLKKEGAV